MARKLKTFQTSLGFYDLAIAAPSMKAALEAWGAGSNLFHQGAARETDDPEVVAATMSKPGMVLKRPAGSNGRFAEQAELPDLKDEAGGRKKSRRPEPKVHAPPRSATRMHARPLRSSSESRSGGRPSVVGKRRRGRRSGPSARSWSRKRRRRWTRRSGSTKNGRRPSTPNGPRSRSGSGPKTSGGRRKGKG